jgi:hypothetical protein
MLTETHKDQSEYWINKYLNNMFLIFELYCIIEIFYRDFKSNTYTINKVNWLLNVLKNLSNFIFNILQLDG